MPVLPKQAEEMIQAAPVPATPFLPGVKPTASKTAGGWNILKKPPQIMRRLFLIKLKIRVS
jgi:hypothetical protein